MQPAQGGNWIGRTIDGRYVVESLLGQGGMGVVLRVRHKYTGQQAALKLLHPHLRMQGDLAQRFLAEARAPAAIGHPGIVTVVDAGFSPEGELYLVMELLRGMTLAGAMQKPLPFAAIRRIGLEILAALGAAHAAGFIHRDLKPENVFLADPAGTVKLLDFGIAKVLDERLGARGETQTGMVMGTVAYMSPEQLRDSRNVDRRTDLWAVGVMIYELATGRLPYQADTLGNLLLAMMSQPPRSLGEALAEVPPALDVFLRRALAVDVHQRFGTAAEMAAVLNSMHVLGLQRRAQPIVLAPGAPVPMAPPAPPPMGSVAPVVAPPSVASVRVPPPSVPPPVAAAPSVPPSIAAPAAATAALPSRSRTPMIVAIAAIVAAVGMAVALVLVLTTKKADNAPAVAIAARDAASAPAPDAAVPPDAAPPPPDAAPAPRPTPTPTPTPPKERSARDVCKSACVTSQKKCGIAYVSSCLDTCLQYPPATIACFAAAGDDCDKVGSCGFAALCGGPPSGANSCSASAACMIACGNDVACTCKCARAMHPKKTNLLLRFASCAITSCGRDCGLSTESCLACVQARCQQAATACAAQ